MNRFLVPVAAAVLLAGCAQPAMFGLQSEQRVEADSTFVEIASKPTVIVREIHHEVPVAYVDTVYLEEWPAPAETVYVEEVYESYVYVPDPVLIPVPVHPDHHRPRWRPRGHHPGPRDRPRDEGPRGRRDRPTKKEQPRIVMPRPPVQKHVASVMDDRQKSPDKPTPPVQPAAPKLQAPAKGRNVPADPGQIESPKRAPAPPVDRPASAEAGEVHVQVGMTQARRK
jgi:hypothetical protein